MVIYRTLLEAKKTRQGEGGLSTVEHSEWRESHGKLFDTGDVTFVIHHLNDFKWAKGRIKCIESFSSPSKLLSVFLTFLFRLRNLLTRYHIFT